MLQLSKTLNYTMFFKQRCLFVKDAFLFVSMIANPRYFYIFSAFYTIYPWMKLGITLIYQMCVPKEIAQAQGIQLTHASLIVCVLPAQSSFRSMRVTSFFFSCFWLTLLLIEVSLVAPKVNVIQSYRRSNHRNTYKFEKQAFQLQCFNKNNIEDTHILSRHRLVKSHRCCKLSQRVPPITRSWSDITCMCQFELFDSTCQAP